jgi:hypothetical protein
VIKGRNRRSIQEFEGTPVEALFQHKTEHELVAARNLADRTRRALERCKTKEPGWTEGQRPTLDKLYELVASAGATSVPLSQLATRLATILVKYPPPVKTRERGETMLPAPPAADAPADEDEDDEEANQEVLQVRLTTMLQMVDRMRSGTIDFQLFARCFAIDTRDRKGEADAAEPPTGVSDGSHDSGVRAAGGGGDDSTADQRAREDASDGGGAQELISGVTSMHTWWKQHELGRELTNQPQPCRRRRPTSMGSRPPTVPAHLMFTDQTDIGRLCAASPLDHAAITSGSDQRISCTLPTAAADGRVTFAPRAVLLGGRRVPSATRRTRIQNYTRFYFEVSLCEGGANSAVGWADALWSAGRRNGVGERSSEGGPGKSWAFHFTRGLLCESECAEAAEEESATFRCEPGDVISCECDLSNAAQPQLIFRLLGSRSEAPMRVLLKCTRHLQPEDPTCGLVPMISLDGSTTVLVNMGERPFSYAPEGEGVFTSHTRTASAALLPVSAWAHMRREEQTMLEAGPTFATLQSLDGPNSMQLDKDGTAVTTQYAKDNKIVPSVVFQGICLTSGVWYYEVELLQEGNLHRSKIGWVDPRFSCNGAECIGVGDDKHSWSYCPQPDDGINKPLEGHTGGLKCHNGSRWKFGKPWRYGGIVGVGVDVDRGRVYFSYNGNWTGNAAKNQPLGLAFDNIAFRGGIMPAATICGLCGQQVQFNFVREASPESCVSAVRCADDPHIVRVSLYAGRQELQVPTEELSRLPDPGGTARVAVGDCLPSQPTEVVRDATDGRFALRRFWICRGRRS